MVGTMVLVLMGCGVAVSLGCDPVNNIPAVVGTAFAFGLAVVAMAYTIGGISGCHINPAITLGCFLTGRINGKDCGMYMLFQVIGAFIGSLLLFILTENVPGLEGTGANDLQANVALLGGCNSKDQWRHKQLCRTRHWSVVGVGTPRMYSLYGHFSESGPFYRSSHLPGRNSFS